MRVEHFTHYDICIFFISELEQFESTYVLRIFAFYLLGHCLLLKAIACFSRGLISKCLGLSPGELWLGLKKIHQLTTEGDYSLHVTLKDFDNKTYHAVYAHFEVIREFVKKTDIS